MAKLTNTPNLTAVPKTPIPVPLAQATGVVTQAGPRPFTVLPPIQGKAKNARKPAGTPKTKVPRLKGEPWFLENFSGLASDIIQLRHYPSRLEGFHCPPCGIAGCRGIVIRGKDGKGEPIEILKIDPQTREQVADYTVNGFIVGATCLLKYGHLDIKKVMAGAYGQPVPPEPTLPEPEPIIADAAAEPQIEGFDKLSVEPEEGEVDDEDEGGIENAI